MISAERFVASGNGLESERGRSSAMRVRWSDAVLFAVVALVVATAVAHAWTPGTHVFLGAAVMRSLALLPPAVAALLREFPHDFLYGSIAADTSIAKKYVPVGRHCHSWNDGMEILDGALVVLLCVFGFGFLCLLV